MTTILDLVTNLAYDTATGELTATQQPHTFEEGALTDQGASGAALVTTAEECPGTPGSGLLKHGGDGHLLWNGTHLINECGGVVMTTRRHRLAALLRAHR